LQPHETPAADQGGGGSLGQLLPKRLWCPFAINAPLFGAHESRNRDQKYSKINIVFRLVKRQDLCADFTQPLIE